MNDSVPPASGLQSRKRIALVCDSLEDDFQSALVEASLAAAKILEVDILVVPSGKLGDAAGKNFIHELVPFWADGIILAAHTIGHLATERQMAAFVDQFRPVPTVTLGEVQGADCCLVIDNETAAFELTQHLVLQHQYRRFAYISGPAGNPESLARERGFLRALREAELRIAPELCIEGDFTSEGGRAAVRELLDRRGIDVGELDALFCANDAMAVGACQELEERSVCIPRDIAVAGFDDTGLARLLPSPLTTIRQPLRELLLDGTRMLLEGLRTGTMPRGLHRYSAEPILRRSCGCPRLPNLPFPSTPTSPDEPGRQAVRRMQSSLRQELDEDFVASLDRVSTDWLTDVLDALMTQLEVQGTFFYDAVEELCIGLLRAHRPTSGWQNTLLVLRRFVARALRTKDQLTDLDRCVDGAMRLTSEMTTSFLARQREELLEHLKVLSDATAGLLSAPDLGTIARVVESSFPKLGVDRGMICVFNSEFAPDVSCTPLCLFGLEEEQDDVPVFPAIALGPDEILRGRSWVVEPLGAGQRPLGFAVLEGGLEHVSWYERLRDALTAAVNGAQLMQQVQRLVVTDPLTGLNNRRYLSQKIRQELDPERGGRLPLSLLVLDLDGFKSLNDEQGHDQGDRALIQAANTIKRCLRETDTLARFGGDEFVAVLPGTSSDQARAVARRVIESLPHAIRDTVEATLTCSIGIATIDRLGATGEAELFRSADQALLAAKRGGKNRAIHAQELVA